MKNRKIKIGVHVIPPMVIESKNGFSGFEIELWEKIASKLNINFEYKKYSFKNLLNAIEKKNIDLAIAGITKTRKREILFDFSHDTLESSLSILVSEKQKSVFRTFYYFLKNNYKKIGLVVLLIILFILSLSLVLWISEKDKSSLEYKDSFFETLFLVVSAGTNSGFSSELSLQTFLGKCITIFSMLTGVFLFGFFTATLSSIFTTAKIKYNIDSPEDLRNKKIVTKADTIAVEELEKRGADIITTDDIEKAFLMLKKHTVDAVVFDTPVILNYLKTEKSNLKIVNSFLPQVYGFIFQHNHNLKEYVNREILGIHDTGEYDELHNKYFAKNKS